MPADNCPDIFGNCLGLWAIAQIFLAIAQIFLATAQVCWQLPKYFWQLPRSVGNCPDFLAIAHFFWAIAQYCPVLPSTAQILGAAVSHSPRQNSLISRYVHGLFIFYGLQKNFRNHTGFQDNFIFYQTKTGLGFIIF